MSNQSKFSSSCIARKHVSHLVAFVKIEWENSKNESKFDVRNSLFLKNAQILNFLPI